MQLGSLVAFNTYSRNLSTSLDAIVRLKTVMQPNIISVNRLVEIDKLYSEHVSGESTKSQLVVPVKKIDLLNLNVSLGNNLVFSNFSASFAPGITGIKGPMGFHTRRLLRTMRKPRNVQSIYPNQ